MKGEGKVKLGDFNDRTKPYEYALQGTAENWAYLPGTVGVGAASSLWSGLSEQMVGMTVEAKRTQPFVCPALDFDETAQYEFAAPTTVMVVPKDVEIATPMFKYQASYKRTANSVEIHRTLKGGKSTSRVCTPEDFAASQAGIKQAIRDLRSQFIVQAP
jgi:hypothetical protein